jgi:Transposase
MEYSSDSEDFEWQSNSECGADINPPPGFDSDSESEAPTEPSSRAPSSAHSYSREPSQAPSYPSSIKSGLDTEQKPHSIGCRQHAVTLFAMKEPIHRITALTGCAETTIRKLRRKAIDRRYDPEVSVICEPWMIEDAPRSGRLRTSQVVVQHIIDTVTKNSTHRGWSCQKIASVVSEIPGIAPISARTVYRVLVFNGYSSYKRTVKPGLNDENKKIRLQWCLDHKDWTLEDWKNVIWTDETSVQSGNVRGKRRIWRLASEVYHPCNYT